MSLKILCVDDDPNLLEAYSRQLRKRFDIDTAQGGEEGLAKIAAGASYAVVVSDMRMPVMDGVQFLTKVHDVSPHTVRMMLTGNADLGTAVEAVNQGHVFRFLTKPCPRDVLVRALEDGLEQHRLIVVEKELLSKTLSGSVKLLTDILSLTNPIAFGRAARVRSTVKRLTDELHIGGSWQIEIAAMLSQVGCVALPEEMLTKVYSGAELSPSERRVFESHPQMGQDLLANIPRLEVVSQIIAYQEKRFDGSGPPTDKLAGDQIPIGARLLKLALDFDTLVSAGQDAARAISDLAQRDGWYDPACVGALARICAQDSALEIQSAEAHRLPDGVVLAEDATTMAGTLLVSRGQIVTPTVRMRLRTYARNIGIREPIKYYVPAAPDRDEAAQGAFAASPALVS